MNPEMVPEQEGLVDEALTHALLSGLPVAALVLLVARKLIRCSTQNA